MNTSLSTPILRPAEWVLPGHPDKLADAVADALVHVGMQVGGQWAVFPGALFNLVAGAKFIEHTTFRTGNIVTMYNVA